VVARVYELPDGLGTAAYRFDAIESPKRYKDEYRSRLDALPWDAAERARVAAEAITAFHHSTAVFRDLSATRAG
jgi:heme oxygenase